MNLIYHLLCRYQFSVKGQLSNEMIILKVNCKNKMGNSISIQCKKKFRSIKKKLTRQCDVEEINLFEW